VLAAGAAAAQLGTAFMLTPEAATSPAHRDVLRGVGPTALTRAFTGRTARGLQNRFMREHDSDASPGYPEVHNLTAPVRAAAREQGDADGFNLWAGQAHPLAVELPAGELVRRLSDEAREALRSARS
jgi:nitronate monooxygenase